MVPTRTHSINNHKLLQEIAKKEQQLEAEKKLQKIKDTKKWIGIAKMKQTKLKKNRRPRRRQRQLRQQV